MATLGLFAGLVTILDEHYFVDVATSLDAGVTGLTMLVAPHFFWSPSTGLFAAAYTVAATEGEEKPESLDMPSKFLMMGIGACLLNLLIYHLFFLKDDRDEVVFLQFKLANYAAQSAVLVHTLLFQDPPVVEGERFFSNTFLWLATIKTTAMMVWIIRSLSRRTTTSFAAAAMSTPSQQKTTGLVAANLLAVTYCIFFAVLLTFYPNTLFSPVGTMPFYVGQKEGFTNLQAFLCRLEGAHMMTCAVLLKDMNRLPLQIFELCFTAEALYLLVFVMGAVDPTGAPINEQMYWRQIAVQVIVMALEWIMASSALITKKKIVSLDKSKMKAL
jgi:hypothetical protein